MLNHANVHRLALTTLVVLGSGCLNAVYKPINLSAGGDSLGGAIAVLETPAALTSEKFINLAATTAQRSDRDYPSVVYVQCTGSCYYALGGSDVVASASDTLLTAGRTYEIQANGRYISVYNPSGTINVKLSEFYNENIAWTTLFPISSDVAYEGTITVVCTRQARVATSYPLPFGSTGMQLAGSVSYTFRTNLGLIIVGGASNGSCSVYGNEF